MGEVKIFENAAFGKVRTIIHENGEPWFVAKDVCDALGYDNPSDTTKYLDEDERSLITNPSGEGGSKATIISESGMYSLVLRSRKPEAKAFKKWVTSEVLPSIRKHGMYATDDLVDKMLEDPSAMIRTLEALRDERQRRVKAEAKVAILSHVNKTYTATELAKECGFKSAMAMNDKLHDMGIQFKQNGTWVLYSRYADKGYVEIKQDVLDNGRVIYHRRFTQMGREWLLGLFSR